MESAGEHYKLQEKDPLVRLRKLVNEGVLQPVQVPIYESPEPAADMSGGKQIFMLTKGKKYLVRCGAVWIRGCGVCKYMADGVDWLLYGTPRHTHHIHKSWFPQHLQGDAGDVRPLASERAKRGQPVPDPRDSPR